MLAKGDGRELVEALRPVLAAQGYVVTPNPSIIDKHGDGEAFREGENVRAQSEVAALNRLFRIARSDTHQSKRVADFLLAWWNADRDGGFDLTSLWNLDTAICEDLTIVFHLIARSRSYPDAFGYDAAIRGGAMAPA
ncbi:hypothetical protein [Bradyrhizobium sp. Ash2021]|uniref:DUF7673 family protein n=1 Tax=Bradyrhizobium sp. Ash2021 TaxID=2954771 RepID=UPI0028156C91|nr:hypothetical protein [Bradyrhizobium sp. Ash2021]WMT73326.1 hypothetical protein NL528_36010 [Bradyrhizobium sp. Ash2021]